MDSRRKNRIDYYCNKLNLSRWDQNNLKEFYRLAYLLEEIKSKMDYRLYITSQVKNDYDKIAYKITKSGLYDSALQIINGFFRRERELFDDYQLKFPNLNIEEIWIKVYEEIDKKIDEEIINAKAMSRQQNREKMGCTNALLIFSVISAIILFCLSNLFIK